MGPFIELQINLCMSQLSDLIVSPQFPSNFLQRETHLSCQFDVIYLWHLCIFFDTQRAAHTATANEIPKQTGKGERKRGTQRRRVIATIDSNQSRQ